MIGAVYPIRPPPGRAAERAVNKDDEYRPAFAMLLQHYTNIEFGYRIEYELGPDQLQVTVADGKCNLDNYLLNNSTRIISKSSGNTIRSLSATIEGRNRQYQFELHTGRDGNYAVRNLQIAGGLSEANTAARLTFLPLAAPALPINHGFRASFWANGHSAQKPR
jgi:hypothetical protein